VSPSVARDLRERVSVRPVRAWVRDRLVRATDQEDLATFREDLARRYIRGGSGIEIGALHRPLRVPQATQVRYVDVMSRDELLATHTSAVYGNPKWVVETDVIDECERLGSFADASLDFVIANHILEHTEDPIAALENLVRVLRPDGILLLTLPDAGRTFDGLRPRTSVEHLLRDHHEGPHVSRSEHYREWATVECLPEDRIAGRIAEFARDGARHHFHAWEMDDFLKLLDALYLPATLALAQTHLDEFAIILRRA